MSAEVLREAARLMRSRSRFGAATETADWLDREAHQFEEYGSKINGSNTYWEFGPEGEVLRTPFGWQASTGPAWRKLLRVEDVQPSPDSAALAVARAYLGEAS